MLAEFVDGKSGDAFWSRRIDMASGDALSAQQATAVAPNDPYVLNMNADVRLMSVRLQEGLHYAQRLYEVNPLSSTSY